MSKGRCRFWRLSFLWFSYFWNFESRVDSWGFVSMMLAGSKLAFFVLRQCEALIVFAGMALKEAGVLLRIQVHIASFRVLDLPDM